MRYLAVLLLFLCACEGPVGPEGPQGPAGPEGPHGPPGSEGRILEPTVIILPIDGTYVNSGGWGLVAAMYDVPEITSSVVDSGYVAAQIQTTFLASRNEWHSLPLEFESEIGLHRYHYRYGIGSFQLFISTDSPPIDRRYVLRGSIKVLIVK